MSEDARLALVFMGGIRPGERPKKSGLDVKLSVRELRPEYSEDVCRLCVGLGNGRW